MSMDKGMDKGGVIHIYNGILFSHKRNEIMLFAAIWMDLETIILSEVRQTPYDLTYKWNLKYDTNELIYKTDSRHREQSCGCQGGVQVGKGWIWNLGLADANYYI